jgi:hypothetical protein
MLIDLRLMNVAFRKIPVTVMFNRIQPWSVAGFVEMFISGFFLFWAEPVKCATRWSFILKMIAIIVLGLNMAAFHYGAYKSVGGWDNGGRTPAMAKFAGVVSIVLWGFVISAGRWTAYF